MKGPEYNTQNPRGQADAIMTLQRFYFGLTTRRPGFKMFVALVFGTLVFLILLIELYTDIRHSLHIAPALPKNLAGVPQASMFDRRPSGRPQEAPKAAVKTTHHRIAILAEMKVIVTWSELRDLYQCFLDPTDKSTRTCPVSCPAHNANLDLTITETVDGFVGADATVFGLSPFTLLKQYTRLLKYSVQIPGTQTAVFYSMESPLRVHKWIHRIGHLRYHVDMTYLPGADVAVPYALYRPGPAMSPGWEEGRNYAEGKTGLIAWMGSNCAKEVFWPRMEFVEELGRHLPLDTYGKCGNLTCLPRLSAKCVGLLGAYKFYLALENSECREYLTEKFWVSCLMNGVVPVVYGPPKEDLYRLAPPNSFIHASDFDSVRSLAEHIQKVAGSDELYNRYFEWRSQGSVLVKYPALQPEYFCDLVPLLQGVSRQNVEARVIGDSAWFNSCRGPIKRRFNLSHVPILRDWRPWMLGVNNYLDGY